jgi:lipid-A-disaccharide synthase
MKPKTFMVIAGEASGDLLAADLVQSLREELAAAEAIVTSDSQPLYASLEPRFFGAGGPRMAAAGVELAFDLTAHSVIGISEAARKYWQFRRLFRQLYRLALDRQPDAIVCVDFGAFNLRFARAIRNYARRHSDWFHDWNPKIVQLVSPQVWASREGRARQIARNCDLLLSIFPFEKDWYAKRTPNLRVEFIGHPMIDRHLSAERGARSVECWRRSEESGGRGSPARVVLLPGSRQGELRRHVPVLAQAAKKIVAARAAQFRMVLPTEPLAEVAKQSGELGAAIEVQVGRLEEALAGADLAITKSGTVTMDCACFGVPAVVFYKTSAATYFLAKRIVKIKHLAMPNLLAGEEVFPEFVQGAATADNVARAALELLQNENRRQKVRSRLAEIIASLGGPGGSRRAARAIMSLLHGAQPGSTPAHFAD